MSTIEHIAAIAAELAQVKGLTRYCGNLSPATLAREMILITTESYDEAKRQANYQSALFINYRVNVFRAHQFLFPESLLGVQLYETVMFFTLTCLETLNREGRRVDFDIEDTSDQASAFYTEIIGAAQGAIYYLKHPFRVLHLPVHMRSLHESPFPRDVRAFLLNWVSHCNGELIIRGTFQVPEGVPVIDLEGDDEDFNNERDLPDEGNSNDADTTHVSDSQVSKRSASPTFDLPAPKRARTM